MSGQRDDDGSLVTPRQALIGLLALVGALGAGSVAGLSTGYFFGVVAGQGLKFGLVVGIIAGVTAAGFAILKLAHGLHKLIATDSRRDEEPPHRRSDSATPPPANPPPQ